MELHTYSSTDPKFLIEFKNSMQNADIAIIYMSEKAFEIKNKTAISDSEIRKQFNQENIQVFRKPEDLANFLKAQKLDEYVLLMMSSGNFDGLDFHILLNNV